MNTILSTDPQSRRQWREPLTSPRRVKASQRVREAIRLRSSGHTWQMIAMTLGYSDASGPYRAIQRTCPRLDFDALKRAELKRCRQKVKLAK